MDFGTVVCVKSTKRIHYITKPCDYDTTNAHGTGFIISDKRIITNYHVIDTAELIYLLKQDSQEQYKAYIVAQSIDTDLAILGVYDEKFWDDTTPFELEPAIPKLRDNVTVIGYQETDIIAYTKTSILRISILHYSTSHMKTLQYDLDTPTKGGVSGGPVINHENRVIGVLFQGDDMHSYCIPTLLLFHFLRDPTHYKGLPSMGIALQETTNINLKSAVSGPRISKSHTPLLKPSDILHKLDGYEITNNVRVCFRDGEYVPINYLYITKYIGDTMDAEVYRNNKLINLKIPLARYEKLIQPFTGPEHVEYKGMYFVPLTTNFIYHANETRSGIITTESINLGRLQHFPGEQIVIFSHIVITEETMTYNKYIFTQVTHCNSVQIKNISHLRDLIKKEKNTFETCKGDLMVA